MIYTIICEYANIISYLNHMQFSFWEVVQVYHRNNALFCHVHSLIYLLKPPFEKIKNAMHIVIESNKNECQHT